MQRMPKFHYEDDPIHGRVIVVDLNHIRPGCCVRVPLASIDADRERPRLAPSPPPTSEIQVRRARRRPGRN